jgi:hypothetical protein
VEVWLFGEILVYPRPRDASDGVVASCTGDKKGVPFTAIGTAVEPLPVAAMSTYPYGPGER